MGSLDEEFVASTLVPAGRYVRVDDASGRVIELLEPGRLPPSFDGRVAVYRRLPDLRHPTPSSVTRRKPNLD